MEHIIYPKDSLPKKNKFILALMLLRFPLFIPGVSQLIKLNLKYCKNIDFKPGFFYLNGMIYGQNVWLSDCFIMDYAPIYIGEGSKFSWQCMIATGYHDNKIFDTVHAKSVIIGKNVTVYARTIILGGVRIGDNSIIGAGSVVTRDIPPNYFAAGNPARLIKRLK